MGSSGGCCCCFSGAVEGDFADPLGLVKTRIGSFVSILARYTAWNYPFKVISGLLTYANAKC